MSYSVDANVLLYASDAESPWHRAASDFLASCVVRPDLFCICWPTLMAYLRISTHSGIFASPLSPKQAESNGESLLAQARVRVLGEGESFWPSYRALTEVPIRGNLVPDAHVAALLLEHGVGMLYSCDRDFLKFTGLRVEDPFADRSTTRG